MKKKTKKKRTRIFRGFAISPELHRLIGTIAVNDGVSRSEVIKEAVEQFAKQHGTIK